MKISSIHDIEKIRDDISSRYKEELQLKNNELLRLENIFNERTDSM